jgi:methanogenic corrinoid protein MtbC1
VFHHSRTQIKELVNEALEKCISAVDIVQEGLRRGLEAVGRKYENGEFLLSELLYSGKL